MPEEQPAPKERGHDERGLDLARSIARGLKGRTGARRGRRTSGPSLPSDPARRGEPGAWSGAHPDELDPQPLEAAIDRLVASAGWDTDLRVHGVFARWGAIVGREVAEHCTPEAFAEGRLVVRTDSTAWATQITLLAAQLVRRLNQELGEGTVRVIDVQPPRGPTWRKGRLRVKGRGPRDTYG